MRPQLSPSLAGSVFATATCRRASARSIAGAIRGAFVAPPQFTFGNAARGILVGPRSFNLDLGVSREFLAGEERRVQFRWEMLNAFNRVNFEAPNTAIGNPQGQISETAPARIMQPALNFYF